MIHKQINRIGGNNTGTVVSRVDNEENHLLVTYTDGKTEDVGVLGCCAGHYKIFFNAENYRDENGYLSEYFKICKWQLETFDMEGWDTQYQHFEMYQNLPMFDLQVTASSLHEYNPIGIASAKYELKFPNIAPRDYDIDGSNAIPFNDFLSNGITAGDIIVWSVENKKDGIGMDLFLCYSKESNEIFLVAKMCNIMPGQPARNPKQTVSKAIYEFEFTFCNIKPEEEIQAIELPEYAYMARDTSQKFAKITNYIRILEESIPQSITVDVTEMFTLSQKVKYFFAKMYLTKDPNRPYTIRILAYDTSGATNNLIITAAKGWGAIESKPKFMLNEDNNGSPVYWKIDIVKETAFQQCTMTVPNGCYDVDFEYFVGEGRTSSYYIDSNQAMHQFDIENTPIANFCNTSSNVTINGVAIPQNNVSRLVFGSGYATVTDIPANFLNGFKSLNYIDLEGLSNVTTIGGNAFKNTTNLITIDFTPFSSVTTIGGSFMIYSGVRELDIRPLKPTNKPTDFISYCRYLTKITIDTDGTEISNIGTSFYSTGAYAETTEPKIIYAPTVEIGNAFKNRFSGTLVLDKFSVELIA